MSNIPNINSVGQVKAFERQLEKQVIQNSVFASLSNLAEKNAQVGNAGEPMVPDAVMTVYKSVAQKGVIKASIPSVNKLFQKGAGGRQKLKGTEETYNLVWKEVHFNVQRKAVSVEDQSVDGDAVQAYPQLTAQVNTSIGDWFADLTDYNVHRAIIWGADEFLTEAAYWTGPTFSSAPVTQALHPTILYPDAAAPVTWNATLATYVTAVGTAVDTAGFAGSTFGREQLNKMVKYASARIRKLGWKTKGGSSVSWIALISREQRDQLTSATGDGSWYEAFKDADNRGVSNRAITGIVGTYRGMMVIENERAPLFNSDYSAADESFQFVKPWIDDGVTPETGFEGDNRVPVAKTSSAGTCEVGIVLGRGALGVVKKSGIKYVTEVDDYDFFKSLGAQRHEGCERMDFAPNPASVTARPQNWSSFLYLTPTPAVSY